MSVQQGRRIATSSVGQASWQPLTSALRSALPLLLLVVLAGSALVIAQIALRQRLHPLPYEVPIGSWPDQLFVSGFYEREGKRPNTYRWTTEGSELHLRQIGSSAGTRLGLRLGELPSGIPPHQLDLHFNERPFAAFDVTTTPRTYHLLVPQRDLRSGDLIVGFGGPTFSTAKDSRRLGVRLDHATLRFSPGSPLLPAPRQVAEQLALLGIATLTLRRLGWSLRRCGIAVALLALGLLLVYSYHLLLLDHYSSRLLAATSLVALGAWWLPPLLARYAPWAGPPGFHRQVAGLLVLGCMLRLVGALFPTFGAHDLPRNIERLLLVHGGDLVITARSAEFGSGFTVYPPAPYVVLLPLGLFGADPTVIVQGGLALLDGTSTVLIALLARRLGLGLQAALLAGISYAALPISLTCLWWGFTAQAFGQWLMVPLALALVVAFERSGRWPWVLATTCFAIALLSHIGVAILAVAWLALALPLLWKRLPPQRFRAYLAVLAVGGLLGFTLIYLDVAASMTEQFLKVGDNVTDKPFQVAYNLVWKGLLLAFSPVGLALIAPGLALLSGRLRPRAWALLAAWVASVLFFFGVELLFGLQVRYLYFFMPVGCLALGLLLDRLAARGAAGRATALTLAALLLAQGALLWYGGTFEELKLSITPLSH